MAQYYCPYCHPIKERYKIDTNGVMICCHCGEPIHKRPFIKATQLLAWLAIAAFISPLLLMVTTFLKDDHKPQENNWRVMKHHI